MYKPTKPAPTPSRPPVDVKAEKTRRLKEKQDAQREAELAEMAKKEGADEGKNSLLREQEKWETERLSFQMALKKAQGEMLQLQLDKEKNTGMDVKGGGNERGKRGGRTDQEERKRKDYRLQRSDDGAADSAAMAIADKSTTRVGVSHLLKGAECQKENCTNLVPSVPKNTTIRKKHARASSSEPRGTRTEMD
jgi:hypothetical protein